MKTKPQKLTSTREYHAPKSIALERTFELYGDQRMSLSESPVRTTAGQLTAAMMREAAVKIKAKKDRQ
ncbi:hypothetical protein JHL22_05205 [Advenella sp. WQ 585]|uniref:Uncharacterized protein n=1 Tax=Advenella mandrilli TaxID=2800330 RepID=A0ABS1EAQ2_9BURK|nr:hypothetical protein [Advenella mandrilli]MBK1780609.1 hypothetical protein [Advenella mandrilli]